MLFDHFTQVINELDRIVHVMLILCVMCGQNGLTPLHWACVYGPVEVVAFLDELGADVNATNYVSPSYVKVAAEVISM